MQNRESTRACLFYTYFVRTETLEKVQEVEIVFKKRLQESTLRRFKK